LDENITVDKILFVVYTAHSFTSFAERSKGVRSDEEVADAKFMMDM